MQALRLTIGSRLVANVSKEKKSHAPILIVETTAGVVLNAFPGIKRYIKRSLMLGQVIACTIIGNSLRVGCQPWLQVRSLGLRDN